MSHVKNNEKDDQKDDDQKNDQKNDEKNDQKKQKPRRRRRYQKSIRKRGRKAIPDTEMVFLKPSESDILKLLAAQSHIGRRRSHVNMNRYIWKRRQDGVHVINLEKTWAKLVLASRILVTVNDPRDICVMSSRNHGQRGAIKFAHYTGATAMVGKWVPGTFTNPQNKAFFEPRVVLVDDPSTCFAALRETSYIGVPVIAFCGIDNNTKFVDCAIPCNNRGTLSVGLMFWLLTRELLILKGEVQRGEEWAEAVDLFFYRDAGQIQRQQEAKARKAQKKQQADLQHQYERSQYQDIDTQAQQQQEIQRVQEQQLKSAVQQQLVYQQTQEQNWEMPDQTGLEDWGAPQVQQLVIAPVIGDESIQEQFADGQGQGQGQAPFDQQQEFFRNQPNQQQTFYDGGIPTVPW